MTEGKGRCPHGEFSLFHGCPECIKAAIQAKEEKCPHIIRKQAGDESYDVCELNTKSCLIEHGLYDCEIWDEIKAEWKKEAPRQKTLGDVLIETANEIRRA